MIKKWGGKCAAGMLILALGGSTTACFKTRGAEAPGNYAVSVNAGMAGDDAPDVSRSVSESANQAKEPAMRPGPENPESQLPPIMPVENEEVIIAAVKDALQFALAKELEGGSIDKVQEVATLASMLNGVFDVCSNPETAQRLFMYKYVVRFAVERMLYLVPGCDANDEVMQFFTDGRGHWRSFIPAWEFDSFEEANYAVLYGSGATATVLPSAKGEEWVFRLPYPNWASALLVAVRDRNLENMQRLHNLAGYAPAPQWPVEVFRQLFTYASTDRGEEQLRQILQTTKGKDLRGASWAEVGYGTGMIFGPLRELLGPNGKIIGTEIDDSCEKYTKALLKSGKTDWGEVQFVRAKLNDCCLPPNSVDIIHPGLVHLADGPDELIERDWLPLFASMKRALRPGGLILVDNGGSPTLDKVRKVMEMAGFEEVAVTYEPHEAAPGCPIYYASYRVKK